MEVYGIDRFYDKVRFIEGFKSLIWTERFQSWGDFELLVREDIYFQNLKAVRFLGVSNSRRIMMVETVTRAEQTEGDDLIKVTGRSIEAFLENRSNKNGSLRDPERVSGTTSQIIHYFVNQYCVNPATAGAVNVIPGLSVNPSGAGVYHTRYTDRGDIYTIVKSICESDQMGFEIRREDDLTLSFNTYYGSDRSDPTDIAYTEFSADNDSLTSIASVSSRANYKNHARVLGAKTGADVYSEDVLSSVSGLDRRTIVVEATDIGSAAEETDPLKITTIAEDIAALTLRGKQVLRDPSNRYVNSVDGTVPQYFLETKLIRLGDIYAVKDAQGIRTRQVLTERMWTLDESGMSTTPTFSSLD